MSDNLDKIISYYNMPVKRKLSNDFLMQELVDKIKQLDEANRFIDCLEAETSSMDMCEKIKSYREKYKVVSDE
jgi:hypothetical protein